MTLSEKAVTDYLAKGGKVTEVKEIVKSESFSNLRNCQCGCQGNYTDHSMRLGERGMYGQ